MRKEDFPDGKFTLCLVGYGDESSHAVIELTYNHGQIAYTLGDAFGHIAIVTDDIRAPCERERALKYTVIRDPADEARDHRDRVRPGS